MMSMLLLLAGQTVAAPAQSAVQAKQPPAICALLYVGKNPKGCSRERHVQGQIFPLRRYATLEAALREGSVANLKVVKRQESAWTWLEKNLRVQPLDNTSVVRVSLADGSPKEQVTIINAVVKAYLHAVTERDRERLTTYIDALRGARTTAYRKIGALRGRLISLNGVKAENEREALRITKERQDWARILAEYQKEVQQIDTCIAEAQEKMRKPDIFILEWAELPDSK